MIKSQTYGVYILGLERLGKVGNEPQIEISLKLMSNKEILLL